MRKEVLLSCVALLGCTVLSNAATVPCEREDLAFAIAQWESPREASRWVMAVTNDWQTGADGAFTFSFTRPWRWYFRRTTLVLPEPAQVRVNGQAVAAEPVGSVGVIRYDVSSALAWFGANTIEVRPRQRAALPREAYLISEHGRAPRAFAIETTLSADFTSGSFKIRDEAGNILKERTVENPRLWTSEKPYLYMTPVEHTRGWWIFAQTDYYAVTLGFGSFAARGETATVDGRKVALAGVRLAREAARDRAEMIRLVKMIKSANMNAVWAEPGALPADWFDLCDREGVFTLSTAPVAGDHPCALLTDELRGGNLADYFGADGKPTPKAVALKHAQQLIHTESLDWAKGAVTIRNARRFADLAEVDCFWVARDDKGQVAAKGHLDVEDLKPGEARTFGLGENFKGDSVVFRFLADGGPLAWDTFARPNAKPLAVR